MDVIKSKVNVSSEEYKKNYEDMEALVVDLNKELKRSWEERSEKSLNRLKESGKLPAKKKLDLLLDKNTPFLEIAPLAAKDMYDGKIHKSGFIAGIGVVSGKEVLVGINDDDKRRRGIPHFLQEKKTGNSLLGKTSRLKCQRSDFWG